MAHTTATDLEAALPHIRSSPPDQGRLDLIVRRPAENDREVLEVGMLDPDQGLVGDTWRLRPSTRTADGSPHPDMQLNVMNTRVAAVVAGPPERWALAGDQLFVDLDLSESNLPPGTRLALGATVIEITDQPHRGCAKFSARFGAEALRFVNSPAGLQLRLRGVNARVVLGGPVSVGATVRRLPPA